MSKNLFTEYQIKELEKNPNVIRVSSRSISYDPDFKIKAVKEYHKGKSPSQIFIEHDFNIEVIGKEQPKRCLQRWRATFEKSGELGLQEERLKKAEAKIKFLEAENDFLKKLEALREAGVEEKTILTPSEKFELIEYTIRQHKLKNIVSYLCELAGVSRSGYYAWLKAASIREQRDFDDAADYELIYSIFKQKKEKVGALPIKMILEIL